MLRTVGLVAVGTIGGLVGAILLLVALAHDAPAKDVPVVLNDEERRAFDQLCDMAKYANRMGAERLCEYFVNKFAAAEKAAEEKNAKPEGK